MIKRFFQTIFVVLIVLSLYLSLSPASSSVPMIWNDKIIHCLSYFALMLTLDFAWRSGNYLLVKAVLVLLYSILIEIGQSYVPGRDMSMGDVAANAAGVGMFLLLVPVLKQQGLYRVLRLT